MRWLPLLFFSTLLPLKAAAQIRAVFIMDRARVEAETLWRNDSIAAETGLCVNHFTREVYANKDTIYKVWDMGPAIILHANHSAASIICPDSAPILHTHPPSTCTDDNDSKTCSFGGLEAWECFPSPMDYLALRLKPSRPFGLIMCDNHAIIAYYGRDYVPVPDSTNGKPGKNGRLLQRAIEEVPRQAAADVLLTPASSG